MDADDTPHCRCKTWYLYKSRQAINKVEMLKKSKIIGPATAGPTGPVPTPMLMVSRNRSEPSCFNTVHSHIT